MTDEEARKLMAEDAAHEARQESSNWREHLSPEEAERLGNIDDERRALSREYRRIFDRARKRAIRP